MKEYSRQDWGITPAEYNRLLEAVEQGIIPDFAVEGHRYELQHGLTGVDELIHGFDRAHRFHSNVRHSRDSIDDSEFERIVSSVLDGESSVASYKFFSMGVEIHLHSRA